MCGIAGVINYHSIDLNKIILALKHRGPDQQSIYTDDNIALLHTRLAIQDIHHGSQPFHFNNYSIVFNGEIYNHLELREQLSEFNFKTKSDTETLLYLFIKFRYKMFDMLDGMFAFCIFDKIENKLILARDRAGKKPLYYFKNENFFIFSSELNALKSVIKFNISNDAINCYLRTGFIWKPFTAYKDVYKLEAGTCLTVDISNFTYNTYHYFDLIQHYQTPFTSKLSLDECITHVESKLQKSIQYRLTASDVEVGIFLSGGIDSNLIVALAAQQKPNLKTFTVKFSGLYDESSLARLTAQKYHTDHTEIVIANQLGQDIEKIISAFGEPFMDSSAIPCYYIAKEARQYVKVILSGDGADELFAGYRRYVPASHNLLKYVKLIAPLLKIIPKPKHKQSVTNYLSRLIAMAGKNHTDCYLSATTDIFEDILQFKDNSILNNFSTFINNSFNSTQMSALNKFLYTDFNALLFNDLLVKMDIASMANGLEVRSPFLSKDLLEFAPKIPGSYKIHKLKTKYILRRLSQKYLPPSLINQPKRGFEVPLTQWVEHELRDPLLDALQPGCYSENFIDRTFIHNLLSNKVYVPQYKKAKMLWSLFCLEIWYKNETKHWMSSA